MPAIPSHSSSTVRWQFSQVRRTLTGVGEKVIDDMVRAGCWGGRWPVQWVGCRHYTGNISMMKHIAKLAVVTLSLALLPAVAGAQVNAGTQPAESSQPFTVMKVTTLNLPWRIGFLPGGRMLITEKVGPVWLVTQEGVKTPVTNVPAVLSQGQGGMLGVFLSPKYATDHFVYLTYAEPGTAETGGG